MHMCVCVCVQRLAKQKDATPPNRQPSTALIVVQKSCPDRCVELDSEDFA